MKEILFITIHIIHKTGSLKKKPIYGIFFWVCKNLTEGNPRFDGNRVCSVIGNCEENSQANQLPQFYAKQFFSTNGVGNNGPTWILHCFVSN